MERGLHGRDLYGGADPLRYCQLTIGTHPTGMLSCSNVK